MMNLRACTGLLALGLFCTVATADEIRLKDGRVLVGKVQKRGSIVEVATRDGTVRVNASEVLVHRTDETLREALDKLRSANANTDFGCLQLAKQAHAWGLEPEMWKLLDQVVPVRSQKPGSGMVSCMNDFLAQLEPAILPRRLRKANTQKRVRELLFRVRKEKSPGWIAAVEELLVREPNADRVLRAEARYNMQARRRLMALEALVRRGTGGNDRFLYRTAILDNAAEVRAKSMTLARRHANAKEAVDYLAPGLMHPNHLVRMLTADAYANLGEMQGARLLVAAGPAAGAKLQNAGDGIRGHIAILNQEAYIRDFDVEVAQASFIADPKVDVLQSGVVMDVTLHSVITHRTEIVGSYRRALKHLVGSDPGSRTEKWDSWLASVDEDKKTPVLTPPRGRKATGRR